jgi:hypothetical protein
MHVTENTKSGFGFHVADGRGNTWRQYRVRSIDPIRSFDVVNGLPNRPGRAQIPQENHRIGVDETPPNGSACVVLLYACPHPVAEKARITRVPEAVGT